MAVMALPPQQGFHLPAANAILCASYGRSSAICQCEAQYLTSLVQAITAAYGISPTQSRSKTVRQFGILIVILHTDYP